MGFEKQIFERATAKGVADYLLYGMVPEREDRSYKTRLDDADAAYEKVAKQYDEDGASVLLSAANELVNENASVYMELGLQAGFALLADIFQTIHRKKESIPDDHTSDSIGDIEDGCSGHGNVSKKTILQQFIQDRMDTAMEDTLRKDRKYQKSKQDAEAKVRRLTKDLFTSEQWNLIDAALEESNASASEYGRVAYQQGFFDTLELLKEIRLQGRNWV